MNSSYSQTVASKPPHPSVQGPDDDSLRQRLWRIIFLSDTFAGRLFDMILLVLIGICVVVVMLESIEPLRLEYLRLFSTLEHFDIYCAI
jgi:hypothetical protein